jgi:PEP-CTERM motif-containing protein
MKNVIPVLAAGFIATIGASSAAQAALVDFGAVALGGNIVFGGGATLDTSSALDLDGATLAVSSIGPGDESGLSVFPTGVANTVTLSHPIVYGTGSGTVDTPLPGDILKAWSGIVNGKLDNFVEKLTTVVDIDRATMNAITVSFSGELTDSLGLFNNTPALLILGASQVGGHGEAISASLTDTAASVIPEPSTWVMMGLGFVALGYAAVRRSSKDRSALAI